MASNTIINPETIAEFFEEVRPEGLVKIAVIGTMGGKPLVSSFKMPEAIDAILDFCEKYKTSNLYYELNPSQYDTAAKSKEKDISEAVGIVIDLDPDCSISYQAGKQELRQDKLQTIEAFAVKASMIIDSGNGLQIIYLFNEPVTEFDRVKRLSKSLAKQFGGDATYSLDHLFRLPGTINHPNKKKLEKGYPETPTEASILINNESRCSLDEIENSLNFINSVVPEPAQANLPTSGDNVVISADIQESIQILNRLMSRDSRLRNRWSGDTTGLEDTSRSGMDFSMVSLLKHKGIPREHVYNILSEYPYGKLTEKEESGDTVYFDRMWDKVNVPDTLERLPHPIQIADENTPASNDDSSEPLFTRQDASIVNFLENTPPERVYLFDDCLPLGKVGTLIGQGGTSKSTLALQLAIAIATGSDPCEGAWQTASKGQVLCLFAEDDKEEIHRRVHHFAAGLNERQKYLLKINLYIKSLVAQDNLITVKDSNGEVATTQFLDRLLLTIEQFDDLKLIIIDPASRFRGGDENTSQDATRFVEAAEQIVESTGATVLIIHHANKASANNGASQNSARGSSAFIDGIRWAMEVRTMSEKEYDDKKLKSLGYSRYHYMSARVVKNNYAPPQGDDIWLLRGENGLLEHVPHIDGMKDLSDAHRKREIVQTVVSDAREGKYHSITSFKNEYSGKDGKFQLGKDSFVKVIKGLITETKLTLVTATREHKAYNPKLRDVLKATAS